MKKNPRKIQISLALVGLALIFLTYFFYPNLGRDRFVKTETDIKNFETDVTKEKFTTFESLEYKGLYDFDKPFTVKSKKAHILNEDPDVVYMTSMHVLLYLDDGRIVNITSNKGRYNKQSYDCFFEENVRATDDSTIILSDNLDLLATENSVEIYNNVSLDYAKGYLEADKINYNFETKYFKVSMFDDKAIKMKIIQ
tara:strand:- start:521 stop:1111 length:591 start_codon:yes stop_codon:yes gene_type:complete